MDETAAGEGRAQAGPARQLVIRRVLMISGIAAVAAIAAWFYLTGGRYIGTGNAYIKAAKISIAPQVSGPVVSVKAADNQMVRKGEALLVIDPAPYKIALGKARAELAETRAKIEQLKAEYRQKREDMARAQVEADFAKNEYDRRLPLTATGAVSRAVLDDTKHRREAALKNVAALRAEMDQMLAALGGNPDIAPGDHPLYRKAQAVLEQAELDLEHATVRAPADGMVGSVPNPGDYARAGFPLLNLVGTEHVWIEANYKETELTNVRVGQPVTIEVDTYPGRDWKGRVESISPATGSEFSVLPAQNATGNWVKVVQRIAVRISVDQGPEDLPLRTGMSTYVTIDTGHYPHLSAGKGQ